jgi:hypothetical protein
VGLFTGLLRSGGVKFVRKYSETKTVPQTGQSGVVTYEVFKARTAQEAREFLNGKTVAERLYYIVVETPEGNWGKDIEGLYKE